MGALKTKNFTLQDFADMSRQFQGCVPCDLELDLPNGETFTAYEVSVQAGDLLFFCDKGTVTALVDYYGPWARPEIYDWETNEEECAR